MYIYLNILQYLYRPATHTDFWKYMKIFNRKGWHNTSPPPQKKKKKKKK